MSGVSSPGMSSPGKRALVLLLIALIAAVVAAGDADDPLADLEDPLDGFDDVGLDQEARRAEDGPDARQQQPPPPPRGEEPKRPSPGMQWWAKYAWSAVIGGAVLYMFRGFWNACPSYFSSAVPFSQRRKASSSHLIKPVVSRSDLDKIVKDARIALVDFGAAWCGPCKDVHPVVEKVADEYLDDGLVVAEVDVDHAKDGIDEGIKTLPTFRLYMDGAFEGDFVGAPGLTEARRAIRKAIARTKSDVATASAKEISRVPHAKTPPRAAAISQTSDAIAADGDGGNSPLVTDADVTPDMLPTVEKLVRDHREATGEPWKCTKLVSITRKDDATMDVKLIICCGDMCQRKIFSVPNSASASQATLTSRAPTAPDPALMKNPQVQQLLQCGADACSRGVAGDNHRHIWSIPGVVESASKAVENSAAAATAANALPSDQPIHLSTMEQFSTLCQKHPRVAIIVDFGATWCGPCQRIAPVFSQMAQQYGQQAVFCKVDTDESPALKNAAGVSGIPHFIFYRGGAKFDELVGANAGSLLQKVTAAISATAGGSSSGGASKSASNSSGASRSSAAGLSQYVTFQGSNTKNTTSRRRATVEASNFALEAVSCADGKILTRIETQALAAGAVLSSSELSQLRDLEDVLERDNMWHAGALPERGVIVLGKMLSTWPHPFCIPALDLARLAVLHPDGMDSIARLATDLTYSVACFAEERVGSNPVNSRLALRFFANFVASAGRQGRPLSETLAKKILGICQKHVANADDRPMRDAVSALLFNIVCSVLSGLNEGLSRTSSTTSLSAATGIAVLLLGMEGNASRRRGGSTDTDKTTVLVIRRCLNALAEIVTRAPAAAGSVSSSSGGGESVDMWLAIGNAATTVQSSDDGVMRMRKKLLDAVSRNKKAGEGAGASGGGAGGSFPNPWA